MTKNVVLLGATGSIGSSTLDVIRNSHGDLSLVGLCAHSNTNSAYKISAEFNNCPVVITSEPDANQKLIDLVSAPNVDVVLVAIVGFAALSPIVAALKAGKTVALANKEALVTCGEILIAMANEYGGKILPVDSEHNALFQALQGHDIKNVEKLWITGSGGPFRGKNKNFLSHATVSEALKHPNWSMGPKITLDSATLMNKGLEFIEARWVFDINPHKIDLIIHPQSIVHGIVEFIDGSQLAHMSVPDMKAAISYALYYPNRQKNAVRKLNLAELKKLEFEPVDNETFPCFEIAKSALEKGGLFTTALNAANEVAVEAFLTEKVPFLKIPEIINSTVQSAPRHVLSIDAVFEIDAWARSQALKYV